MRDPSLRSLLILLALPVAALSQAQQHATGTLVVTGHPGQVSVIQVNGRPYVDAQALAHLAGASLNTAGTQLILTLPAGASIGQPAHGFSSDFLKAGIEQLTDIREWRAAIVSAVQNNSAVTDNWVSGFRRAADSKLALASAAARTDADRKAFQLLQNEFNNMQQLSEYFLNLNRTVSYTSPTSFDNNPLDTKILTCARALAGMAATNQFQDDPSCH